MSELVKDIKKISDERHIPFPNLLFYYMKCEIIKALKKTNMRVYFKQEPKICEGIYNSKRDSRISVFIENQTEVDLLQSLNDEFLKTSLILEGLKITPKETEIVLSVGKAHETFIIDKTNVEEGVIYPDTKEIEDILNKDKPIEISLYQPESRACDLIIPILDKLELMNDMEVYDEIYTLLLKEPLDGLKLYKTFQTKMELSGYSNEKLKNRIDTFKKYSNNYFLRKKWKAYLRVNRYDSLEWTFVHDKIMKFIEPLEKACIDDVVFLDSWMPELGRFLA
ncbi:MAG: hypothetical protein K5851_02970 [Lachnospiraceae bacterium]|nr:hypothetical protein [Lachnospiraceae bacterium]